MRLWMLYTGLAPVAWWLCAGLLFSQVRAVAPNWCSARSDAGMALAVSLPLALLWPVGIPLAWLLSGFGEYGVWKDSGGCQ